jgi:hypothetical protein
VTGQTFQDANPAGGDAMHLAGAKRTWAIMGIA